MSTGTRGGSDVKDAGLAAAGSARIDWAAAWAPILGGIRKQLRREGSVRDRRIGVILPVEPKTAYLAAILADAGAEVTLAAPHAFVQDDVAAALVERGVEVLARSDSTPAQEHGFYAEVLARRPEVVIDDRAELIRMAHTDHPEALETLTGASEQTTSGVVAMRVMERDGSLRIPCIAANDARCKYLFDNRYGSGQSALAAVMDATNLLAAGKTVLIVGYGWVGKGLALRAAGAGARVVVSEVDPFAALEAYHDGHAVAPVAEACEAADIVITATGCRDALPLAAIERLRHGAVLANAGGIDDEFDMDGLRARAQSSRIARTKVEELRLDEDRAVYVVGDGRCVNLSAGEGHPVEIMDLTFAVQALALRHLLLHAGEMAPGVHLLPAEIDEGIARKRLEVLGLRIDALTEAQRDFFDSWEVPG